MVIAVPPSDSGSGSPAAETAFEARLLPQSTEMEPALNGMPLTKLAALTRPFPVIIG
jgi:hypothetical protein